MDKKTVEKIEMLVAPTCKPGLPGCALGIVQGSELVYEKGFGWATLEHPSPIGSDTVFDVGSMAKQFVGMAIALLEEAGQLDINDEIRRYLPDLPDYAQGVKIANLLYHTSGIYSYTVLAYYMIGYHESDAITREEVYDLLKRLRTRNFDPGTRYEYNDSNYFLLAQIVERVSGETVGAFAERHIFKPLGMQHTLFRECHSQIIPNRAVSYVSRPIAFQSPGAYRQSVNLNGPYHTLVSNYEHVGAEGIFTTLTDLATWNHNFIRNRLGKGGQELVERVLTPGPIRINEHIAYGYGINVGTHKGQAFYGHDGAIHGYTSTMLHFPERETTIICLTNQNKLPAWMMRNQVVDLIFPLPPEKTSTQPLQTRPTPMGDACRISGFYQNPETADIWEVRIEGGRVVVWVNRDWEFALEYVESCIFKESDLDDGMLLRFVLDEAGDMTRIHVTRGEEETIFEAFLAEELTADELDAYAGEYYCEELATTFVVTVEGTGLWLKNKHRHFCSMDLVYASTIRDHFVAYDPHPVSSQVEFIRSHDQVTAFVYRDYDGDGREALRFVRV